MNYNEIIVPSIWEQSTFSDKLGQEKLNQMYLFKDRGDRDCCLIPEVTGIIQELWNQGWDKCKKKPFKVFYIQRCFRYDNPQKNRWREFTQAGIEILGNKEGDRKEVIDILTTFLNSTGITYDLIESVKRGASYYVEDGFEAEVESLGAQKQIAGGGRYKEGIGFAVGIDRIIGTILK